MVQLVLPRVADGLRFGNNQIGQAWPTTLNCRAAETVCKCQYKETVKQVPIFSVCLPREAFYIVTMVRGGAWGGAMCATLKTQPAPVILGTGVYTPKAKHHLILATRDVFLKSKTCFKFTARHKKTNSKF